MSPHCDAVRKLATHIFYFNTEADWDAKWGGEILILDSERQFKAHSAPSFDELKVAASLRPSGNGSLLFQRTPHSWHGVRPLQCPQGQLAQTVHRDGQRAELPGVVAAGARQGPGRIPAGCGVVFCLQGATIRFARSGASSRKC